ncbi:pentatricopeptide repeat-containing family protein [Striga asiatica]|uniref:Pentatricopeptide repeat-containing family protein n=1 Tax=Striga asiatica TaxID=4170 RepID=A0A5A7QS34_STRAF|nr:pentatricopeptide repeat-containing family protein [Striga asiatica]
MLISSKNHNLARILRVIRNPNTARFSSSMREMDTQSEIERIVRLINEHPFPDRPLHPTLHSQIPQSALSAPFVEKILGNLFGAHSNGLKAYELFKYCLKSDQYTPSPGAFEKTLHILTRMRYFDKAWELIYKIKRAHPSLLTLKSMSILLSRIAKFKSYEETLEAFERLQNDVFPHKKFGTNEFNVLLRAFCTQRQMKEARSIFHKMHSRFPPDTKTMNILLLGFKESGDVTTVELFYHEMVRRGFVPNNVTYSIRIDAFCKKGHFGDSLRLLDEMERKGCGPTLETMTTLIHGAGLCRNVTKAKNLFFDEIPKRNLKADTGAYNALLSSFIRSRDLCSAVKLMDEMEKEKIEHDDVTYHSMFSGFIRVDSVEGVCTLYRKMIGKNFVPKARTAVMLMKFLCENRRVDLGLDLWRYLVGKGQCPHGHALELLVTGLCACGRVEEAFLCCKQMLERGRVVSERVVLMMERVLGEVGELGRFEELKGLIDKLKKILPPPKQYVIESS